MNKTLVTLFSLALLTGQIGYSQNTQQLTVTQNTKSQNTNNTQQEIAVNNGQKVNKEYYIDSEIKDELKSVKRDLDQDYLNGQTGDYFKSILSPVITSVTPVTVLVVSSISLLFEYNP